MKKIIALLPGDGVGPEVVAQGKRILDTVAKKYNHTFTYSEGLIGADAIDKTGNPLPDETVTLCTLADAVLFGAIGDPKYDNDPTLKIRPEQGLLKLRKSLGLFANIRPIVTYPTLFKKSPLKEELLRNVDFIVVRELTGGIYFGEKGRSKNNTAAYDVCTYSKLEIERVAKVAFHLALKRKRKVTLVDKANVLETSRLWREVVTTVALRYPTITLEKMFVDNASMQIIKRPSAFDVILTENMFGDILTDEASVITGSIGMLPSASIGEKTAVYEPIHGSYPKAAGLNSANPIGTILSLAMMFEESFQSKKEASVIRNAVNAVVQSGVGTKDIAQTSPIGTKEITDCIIEHIMKE
jgi:3-isopropylmalate dehydrogenase